LADVVTYLDILAFRCGVDLGNATMSKFNRVSERVGSDVWVDAEDWHRKAPKIQTKVDTYITQERGNFGPLKT
jgi:hypothetical protein